VGASLHEREVPVDLRVGASLHEREVPVVLEGEGGQGGGAFHAQVGQVPFRARAGLAARVHQAGPVGGPEDRHAFPQTGGGLPCLVRGVHQRPVGDLPFP
jgi:hypothetical protein